MISLFSFSLKYQSIANAFCESNVSISLEVIKNGLWNMDGDRWCSKIVDPEYRVFKSVDPEYGVSHIEGM